MPREGVPYPGREICSLKCQIDALNAKINELMKSINGVQGDGQGNLSLISGDPAVVINNDASQNQIEIALDGSQLPAAAVSSVNSQTGAVVLEADDIPSDGNSDVQADIDALKALGVNLQGAIGNEVTARGNADAALQGNINTLQASIPGEAAQAVANDPTVQQLAVDVPNKLDKITSGSSLKAYTHTGATQGEKSVVDGVDADSIAIRDASGRLQAADPASGATDKTLVTANWVSQTGDNGPNNLLHRNGQETITDVKTTDDHFNFMASPNILPAKTERVTGTGWVKMYEAPYSNHILAMFAVMPRRSQSSPGYGILMTGIHSSVTNQKVCKWMINYIVPAYQDGVMVTVDTAGVATIWAKNISSTDNINMRLLAENYNGDYTIATPTYRPSTDKTIYTMNDDGQGNYTGYTDINNVTHTFVSYEVSS